MRELKEIELLEHNWDGYGAIPVCNESLINTRLFLERFIPSDISPTTYGTITLDFRNEADESVSVEIGKTQLGMFTDFKDGEQFEIERVLFDMNNLPDKLIQAIKKLDL